MLPAEPPAQPAYHLALVQPKDGGHDLGAELFTLNTGKPQQITIRAGEAPYAFGNHRLHPGRNAVPIQRGPRYYAAGGIAR